MTAIIALKKNFNGAPKVLIGSDSLFLQGYSRMKAKDRSKLIEFPNFIVGFSGLASIQPVIYDIQKDLKLQKSSPCFKMRSEQDALEFTRIVFLELKARLEELGETFEGIGNLVIATPTQIFDVDRYCMAVECEECAFSGCVDEFMAGIVAAKYDEVSTEEELEELLVLALTLAGRHSAGVHPPYIFRSPKQTKIIKKSKKSKK